MADIAQIGFGADTSELTQAKTKLDALVPAATRVERAQARLNSMMQAGANAAAASARADNAKAAAALSAAKATGTATKEEIAALTAAKQRTKAALDSANATRATTNASVAAAAAARKEADAMLTAASASDKLAASRLKTTAKGATTTPIANDNSPGAFKANVGNIAAQFQDIGVTAAMGMNPLLIALQQGTQLSAVFAATGQSAFKTIGAAIVSVLSPTALLTIGIVALGAALLQLVNWTWVAQTALNAIASILPQVAQGVAMVGAAIAVAFAPAIITLFWNLFIGAAAAIVTAVGVIIATVGAIPIAIGLIIADLYIFRDEWTQVLGVDLIGIAKTGINYIIGAFVGAYHDIAFLWKQFPNVIGAAAIGAANMAIAAVNAIIGATIKGLNGLIASVNAIGAVGAKVGLGFSIGEVDPSKYQFDQIANTAADELAKAVGERNTQLQEDLSKDYLGAIGGAVNDATKRVAAQIKTFSADLGAEAGGKGKGKGGAGGASASESFDDIVSGAERSIASLQAQRDAIGQSAEATARLKYETQLLNDAQQKNISLTPAQRDQLIALADQMANLEVSTSKAKDSLDFAKDATKGFVSDLISGLRQGKSLWESFGNAVNNVLDKLIDKLLNQFIDAIFTTNKAAGGGGATGGGGIFGGIISWFSGLFSAKGNVFDGGGVSAFAKGGSFSNSVVSHATPFMFGKGGANLGIMGEAGPEAVMPLKRGPDGSLGVQMHSGGAGGNSSVVIAPTINIESKSTGDTKKDQEQAARIAESVKDTIVGVVRQELAAAYVYGGSLNPRGA